MGQKWCLHAHPRIEQIYGTSQYHKSSFVTTRVASLASTIICFNTTLTHYRMTLFRVLATFNLFFIDFQVISQTLSPVFSTIETCCELGSDWAAVLEHGCDDFQVPVKDILPEMQATCISTMEVCCTKTRREQQCSLGRQAALNGLECGLPGTSDQIGVETYKDCCLSCTLGIIVASMAQRCSGMSAVFGCPLEDPFVDCCHEILNPQNTTTPIKNIEMPDNLNDDPIESATTKMKDTTQASKESLCPEGYQYNSLMNVCDDIDEVKYI